MQCSSGLRTTTVPHLSSVIGLPPEVCQHVILFDGGDGLNVLLGADRDVRGQRSIGVLQQGHQLPQAVAL